MPDGGAVTITAENIVLDPSGDEHSTSRELCGPDRRGHRGRHPRRCAAQIFDPFFTTKPVGKGTGLGLSQVYGFAHQAGGTVKVESGLGKGTRITMYLPKAHDAPVAAEGRDRRTIIAERTEHGPAGGRQSGGRKREHGTARTTRMPCAVRGRRRGRAARAGPRPNDRPRVHRHRHAWSNGRIGIGARDQEKNILACRVLLATGYSDALRDVNGEFPILRKPYQIGELSRALSTLMAPETGRGGADRTPSARRRIVRD